MKKIVLLISIPIAIILFSTIGLLITKNTTIRLIKEYNSEYEYYLDKTIYGTELTSLINKAINENEKNNVQKNEKEHYIDNNKNSIKIEVKFLTPEEKTYQMEEFYKNNMTKFVEIFNSTNFKCTSIEYHKQTGKIKKITFEEIL